MSHYKHKYNSYFQQCPELGDKSYANSGPNIDRWVSQKNLPDNIREIGMTHLSYKLLEKIRKKFKSKSKKIEKPH